MDVALLSHLKYCSVYISLHFEARDIRIRKRM